VVAISHDDSTSGGTLSDVSDVDPASGSRDEPGAPPVPGQVPAIPAGQPHAPIPSVAHGDVIDHEIENPVFITKELSVRYGSALAVEDVSLSVPEKEITAFFLTDSREGSEFQFFVSGIGQLQRTFQLLESPLVFS